MIVLPFSCALQDGRGGISSFVAGQAGPIASGHINTDELVLSSMYALTGSMSQKM